MRFFENRRVLVTESGRGIEKGNAHRFTQGGAKIPLVARTQARGPAVALDLALPDSARQVVTEAAAWSGLHIVVIDTGAAAQDVRLSVGSFRDFPFKLTNSSSIGSDTTELIRCESRFTFRQEENRISQVG